mmetsp:Transcript_13994/g.34483  ORF Transcript_13994/g.34483 Transcript_13994/m.34483 type:complete len:204 (-) Transcript_13994:376-987(-)
MSPLLEACRHNLRGIDTNARRVAAAVSTGLALYIHASHQSSRKTEKAGVQHTGASHPPPQVWTRCNKSNHISVLPVSPGTSILVPQHQPFTSSTREAGQHHHHAASGRTLVSMERPGLASVLPPTKAWNHHWQLLVRCHWHWYLRVHRPLITAPPLHSSSCCSSIFSCWIKYSIAASSAAPACCCRSHAATAAAVIATSMSSA